MNPERLRCMLLCLLFATALPAYAQRNNETLNQFADELNAFTNSKPSASIYLITSKDIYESGEDMWFKVIILDAQYLTLFDLDRTLYLRLSKTGSDSTVWEEKYPIKNGVAYGHIFLDENLPEGNYFLSAYTAHSFYRNMPYYHSYKMIKVIKDARSLSQVKPVDKVAKAASPQDIQFSILPDGGQLISGVANTVAFKAVDRSGNPAEIEGELLQGDKPVKALKSAHAGMGSFTFKPVPGATYGIRLSKPGIGKIYSLPAIRDKGAVLHLAQNKSGSLIFQVIQSPDSVNQPVFLRIQMRGRTQLVASGLLKDSLNIPISTENIPQGIAEATLFDQQMRPLAERLVYINSYKLLNISVKLSKALYRKREKVSAKIKTIDEYGKPVQANIGVSVFDKLYKNPADAKNILTHFYLSTQLKGKIHDPGFYFNKLNKNRVEALDLLLLTQGWRCYLWNTGELKRIKDREPLLTDSTKGRLIATGKKNKPKIQMLMTFSTDESERRPIFTDSAGRFALAPEDFVKGRWSYLKRFDTGKEEYTVSVEDQFKEISEVNKSIPFNYPTVEPKEQDQAVPDQKRISMGAINLNEVKVVAKKTRVFRDKYMGRLDSIAKIDGNSDFVYRSSNWLNVPIGGTGSKPVEGQEYTIWVGPNPPTSVPFNFGRGDFQKIIYHYPKFTEDELLKKFKLTRIKGYYEKREFYHPDYERENDPSPDYRNTLFWLPEIITDKNGEASITFYTSDINSSFCGIIEGVTSEGLLGRQEFQFNVVK